ncbi:MAG TPA: dihydrolipoamide acetyltransferase family protein [Anaerolineaceae bacterium]|nr:dihydrolipoamide acetyltransferase family protein [Anaerolineaceae bacterium]HPN53891.1 dihydrolipoamide acetyltransferase family protein [Anaerolineaceae bacterium]
MADIVKMPKLGFDMAEGTLVRWVKLEGEPVRKGDILAEIETDKATVEVESALEGVVLRHLVEQAAVVPVGTPIAMIGAPGEKIEEAPKPESRDKRPESAPQTVFQPTAAQPHPNPTGRVIASPLARRLAREKGLQLEKIAGSGPGGRIIRKDIEAFEAPAGAVDQPVQAFRASSTGAKSIPVSKLRAAIARRMVESKQQVPHFYLTHTYRVDDLLDLRKKINELLPEEEKISLNDMVIKAVALTLRDFPNLNAFFGEHEIHHHEAIHIGSAVGLDGGLMTVVVKDADQKSLRVIAREMKEMAARARSGKVKPEDIEGSTFSISNLGMYDVENFAAIINPPEAAILAVGSAKAQPAVNDEGEVVVEWLMKATLSVDHRVSDGVEAARFMQALAKNLETPLRLVL